MEDAVQIMLREYETAVDQEWAWGMEAKNVIRRDSIFDDEEEEGKRDEGVWKDSEPAEEKGQEEKAQSK
jgi:hypothetical protein